MTFASYPSLRGRVVAVTGGASGIGADIVRAFAGQGARVAFLDIQDDGGGRPRRRARRRDPRTSAATSPTSRRCRPPSPRSPRALGPVAVLVNNAANDRRQPVAEVTPEDWDLAQNVNLRPQFFAAQAVIPGMRGLGGGSIVNLSSIAWRAGGGEMAPYATAKAGVIGLTRALARACRPRRHPRQRHRARRGDDRPPAPALVPDRGLGRRRWSTASRLPARPPRRGDRPHGALPRRRRQPDDHQADLHRGRQELADARRPEPLRPHLDPRPAGPRHAARQSRRPRPRGLPRHRRTSSTRGCIEIFDPWLAAMPDGDVADLGARARGPAT